MTIPGFQIYYSDYDGNITTYSVNDGAAVDAPEWGVIAIVTEGTAHNWDLHQGDYYLWFGNEETWRSADAQGKEDYLANAPQPHKVLNGRYISPEHFNNVMTRVYSDMPPKSGWYPWESPPPE